MLCCNVRMTWLFYPCSIPICIIGMDKLIEPLKATIYAKVKANSVKQEYEKQEELKRSALRAVSALSCIPDSGKLCSCAHTHTHTHTSLTACPKTIAGS